MSVNPALEMLDSNVLVYAHDLSAGAKHATARALLGRLWNERRGALSVQVLQEFAVNVRRKLARPLSLVETREILLALSEWPIHRPDASDVVAALELQDRYQTTFWDAMILTSARRLGCQCVWSEDLNHGQDYGGVVVRNPFVA